MNRIYKIIGAVAAAGVAVIAGTIYRKGYGKGYNKALRDSDDMGDDFV